MPILDTFPQTSDEIESILATAYRNALIERGIENPQIYADTETEARLKSYAYLALGIVANQKAGLMAGNELYASGADLDTILESLGLARIAPSPASGTFLAESLYSVVIPGDSEIVLDTGIRIKTFGPQTLNGAANLNVVAIDSGKISNAPAGTPGKWVAPLPGVYQSGEIVSLTGGTDEESDSAARARITAIRSAPPASGNWSHLQSLAEQSGASAYVYPALGGPGSAKVAVAADISDDGYSRAASSTIISSVAGLISVDYPGGIYIETQSVADEPKDIGLVLNFSTGSQGWMDNSPWPYRSGNYATVITGGTNSFTVANNGGTIGWKNILIWKRATRALEHYAGMVTLSGDFTFSCNGISATAGDIVMPAPLNWESYLETVIEFIGSLAPGENASAVTPGITRHCRHPVSIQADIDSSLVSALQNTYPEIGSCILINNYSPTAQTTITLPPNVLTMKSLSFYSV